MVQQGLEENVGEMAHQVLSVSEELTGLLVLPENQEVLERQDLLVFLVLRDIKEKWGCLVLKEVLDYRVQEVNPGNLVLLASRGKWDHQEKMDKMGKKEEKDLPVLQEILAFLDLEENQEFKGVLATRVLKDY